MPRFTRALRRLASRQACFTSLLGKVNDVSDVAYSRGEEVTQMRANLFKHAMAMTKMLAKNYLNLSKSRQGVERYCSMYSSSKASSGIHVNRYRADRCLELLHGCPILFAQAFGLV
jgi:hypothetical protein